MSVADWPIETWIGISTVAAAAAGAVAAALLAARKGHDDDAPLERFGPKPHVIKLHDDDRTWLANVVGDLLRPLREAIDSHSRAIRQQTDELERERRDRS